MWNGVNVMTDEQWKEIEKKLVPPFGRAELEIDGYKVVIVAGLVDKMKYGFVVYVNGFIRAEWSMNDCEIRRLTGMCVMPTDGIFAVVLNEGVIRPGDQIEVESI